MFRTVLFPTDGSEQTEAALETALDVASQYGATLHALYVVNTAGIATGDPDSRRRIVETFENRSDEAVEAVAEAAAQAGVDCTTAVARGAPADEILDYAEDEGIDLVVMGTHGRTGLGRFLLGSVAERVARHSTTPVMLVRSGANEQRA
ncbi:universal stress protein [Haladaptatus salinisoli]|uniref:universal stress protein n=1 Tax=Haladaptatus salinisoli TaxID=2884876 RepID=UPI001D0AE2CF|nr:universal stress protein [Haladaptatus salinisoli]